MQAQKPTNAWQPNPGSTKPEDETNLSSASSITRRRLLQLAGMASAAVATSSIVEELCNPFTVEAAQGTTAKNASAISVPKGGASIRGIGETFKPDLFTGT